jgi:DNA-binding response OmpR family regulator
MERSFTILIADRNRRIREFLRRDFVSDGYSVLLADDTSNLASLIEQDDTLDLLILDDEILALEGRRIIEQLGNRIPPLPFIVHSFSTESVDDDIVRASSALVEKRGDIEGLKQAVKQVLRTQYPYRFSHADLGTE